VFITASEYEMGRSETEQMENLRKQQGQSTPPTPRRGRR
jgi:hypothetical protein